MLVSSAAARQQPVAPVARDQHVATISYRSEDGAITHDQPVVAAAEPEGLGFAFAGWPKLEDAVAEARSSSEGPTSGALGVFRMPGDTFGVALLKVADAAPGDTSEPPHGIDPGRDAHLGVSNLGWAEDLDAVAAKRTTDALLMIVDGDRTIDVSQDAPIAPIVPEDDGWL